MGLARDGVRPVAPPASWVHDELRRLVEDEQRRVLVDHLKRHLLGDENSRIRARNDPGGHRLAPCKAVAGLLAGTVDLDQPFAHELLDVGARVTA